MFKAPTQTPSLAVLLDDLPTRDLRAVARHLGVSLDTLRRYARTGEAPRAVFLALFWESRWGLSVIDADVWNRDTIYQGLVGALQRENAQLRAQLRRLVELGSNGAANDGLWLELGPPSDAEQIFKELAPYSRSMAGGPVSEGRFGVVAVAAATAPGVGVDVSLQRGEA